MDRTPVRRLDDGSLPRASRRALLWDVLRPVMAVLVAWLLLHDAPGHAQAPAELRLLLRRPALTLFTVHPTGSQGLADVVLRIERAGQTRDIALDGTGTGRRARAVSDVRLVPGSERAVLHVDRDHDASGLIVVDLAAGEVVDAVVGRDLTPSPQSRYWAFEEHASRTLARWPHTETVYAVYDAGAPAGANVRACPTSDDRCRGQVLFLPDRLSICHAIAKQRGGSCLALPDREPRHARRSPFVWLSPTEVAWVDVDLVRQDGTLVVATMREDGLPAVHAVALERARVLEDVEFPPVREAWTVEHITRDEDRSRLWLHFRAPIPRSRLLRLGVRLF